MTETLFSLFLRDVTSLLLSHVFAYLTLRASSFGIKMANGDGHNNTDLGNKI